MRISHFVAAIAIGLAAPAAGGEPVVGTLTLDGLSFLSFENAENLAVPSGSTIRFRFAAPSSGSASFTIQPGDVSIAPIPLSGNQGKLVYSLTSPASGTIRTSAGGYFVSFTATVQAFLDHPTEGGAKTHTLLFTTERAQARSLVSGATVGVDGMKVVPGPRYVQIVGAVANPTNAYPQPGRAVYTVLSGTFDRLPDL